MGIEVLDDFLPKEDFDQLQRMIVHNDQFPFYFQSYVTNPDSTCEDNFWDWYQTHIVYRDDITESNHFKYLSLIHI